MNASNGGSLSDISSLTPVLGYVENSPAWSPDGTEVVADLRHRRAVAAVIGSDGTGARHPVSILPAGTSNGVPDWQPLVHSYARPKGATPTRDALVPAYKPCGSANSLHQGSLSTGSCNPPSPTSSYLTVGTPDVNGADANSIGSVRMDVFCNGGAVGETPPCLTTPGDQLDGKIRVEHDGRPLRRHERRLFERQLSDYSDDLLFDASARVTDKSNLGFGGNGTLAPMQLRFSVPCVTTASTTVGSTCSTTTTIDSVLGGSAIAEQKRAGLAAHGCRSLGRGRGRRRNDDRRRHPVRGLRAFLPVARVI